MEPPVVQLSILISSCDRYSVCWRPFEHGLEKYWPDCPFPVYLISNQLDFPSPRVSTLRLGKDAGWAPNLISALSGIDTPYVLYMQEDYWLNAPVNTARLREYLAVMEESGAEYLRLAAVPGPDADFPLDPRLGALSPEAEFRTSLQAAIWRKDALLELLLPDENGWLFETDGSVRSASRPGLFLSVRREAGSPFVHGISYVCTAIHGGRWTRDAQAYARSERLDVDFGTFPRNSWWGDFQQRNRAAWLLGRALGFAGRSLRDPRHGIRVLSRMTAESRAEHSN
jgi:hypothetical protein